MEAPVLTDASQLSERPRVYSVSGIGVATFLGSCLAGAVLLASNYRRFGNRDGARKALVGGVLGLIVAAGLGAFLEVDAAYQRISDLALQGAQIGIVHSFATHYQSAAIQRHIDAGGDVFSRWRAGGIALLIAFAIVALLVGVFLLLPE